MTNKNPEIKHIARGKAVINGYATKQIAYFCYPSEDLFSF
jgi:hypothetical protein